MKTSTAKIKTRFTKTKTRSSGSGSRFSVTFVTNMANLVLVFKNSDFGFGNLCFGKLREEILVPECKGVLTANASHFWH
jgi:hypothetical protein